MDTKKSRCAFVVIKLKIAGDSYFLMHKDLDWKDLNLIGGHYENKDKGSLSKTARREAIEEFSALRKFKAFTLTPLTEEIEYGPVWSKSARSEVEYNIQFSLLEFKDNPLPLVKTLNKRKRSVLVSEEDLHNGLNQISELVHVLDKSFPGGLRSIPYSWTEDLKEIFQGDLIGISQMSLTFK